MKNPKYHIGDEVIHNFYGSGGSGIGVDIIKSIQYMGEQTGKADWYYNNGACGFYEDEIIKKFNKK